MTDPEPEQQKRVYRPNGPPGGPLPPKEETPPVVVEPPPVEVPVEEVPPVDPPPSPVLVPPVVPAAEIGARALWTLAEVAVSAAIAWIAGLTPGDDPAWFTAIVAIGSPVLSAVKSFVATKVGNPDTVTFS